MNVRSKSRYDKIDNIIPVGYKANGWECIAKYEHFNLWVHNGVRECFFECEIPNEKAYTVIY